MKRRRVLSSEEERKPEPSGDLKETTEMMKSLKKMRVREWSE